jgi:c-di-GMP-binding flagellar brake protein YcgR
MSAEVRTARTVFTATTRDLSEGGAGVVSDRALSEGEEIALGLFLVIDDVEEHLPPLWVKGQVVWSSELDKGQHMAGVRFSAISAEQKSWLAKVLAQLVEAPPASGGSGATATK